MEKFKINLSLPQKAIDQLIESEINKIIDYINKKNNIKIIEEKEENDENTINTNE